MMGAARARKLRAAALMVSTAIGRYAPILTFPLPRGKGEVLSAGAATGPKRW